MSKRIRKRKCKNCFTLYNPDARNIKRQKFCSKPACRKASKALSQKLWLAKPANKNYFRNPDNTSRVQQWRQGTPGYWKRKRSFSAIALQEDSSGKALKKQIVNPALNSSALQDVLSAQPIVLIGLIAHLTGSALQDDIAITAQNLRKLGNDIINFKGGGYDTKIPHMPRKGT